MLKNTPQLYYRSDELLQLFERGVSAQIEDKVPVRLMFMVDNFEPYLGDPVEPQNIKMECVTITYVPLRFVNKYREEELYYVAEGSEHIFQGIGR